jgi:hypothetical protein
MTRPEFHQLEDYNYGRGKPYILCTFKTQRFGYLQTKLTRMQHKYHGEVVNTWKFETLDQEPDLNMFPNEDIHHMEKVARIVWRMIHDAPAQKGRFES